MEDKQKYFEYLEKKQQEKTKTDSVKSTDFIMWLSDDIIYKLKHDSALNQQNKEEIESQKFSDSLMTSILEESIDLVMSNPERNPDSVFESALSNAQNWSEVLFLLTTYTQQNIEFTYQLSKAFCTSYINKCNQFKVEPDAGILALLFN